MVLLHSGHEHPVSVVDVGHTFGFSLQVTHSIVDLPHRAARVISFGTTGQSTWERLAIGAPNAYRGNDDTLAGVGGVQDRDDRSGSFRRRVWPIHPYFEQMRLNESQTYEVRT